MYRGICAKCNTPATDIGDRVAPKWVHDEARLWPYGWDHKPAPTLVSAS